jgi:uncharacterized protein (TIGR02284 family)
MHDSESIEILERLLVLAVDGVEGYRHAADAVKAPNIRRALQRSAADREEIVRALTKTLVSLGHKPSHHGSIPGAVHRRWLDALRSLADGSAEAVLKECQRGEQATIAGFSQAGARGLPEEVQAIVQAQLGRVLTSSANLRRLIIELEDQPERL